MRYLALSLLLLLLNHPIAAQDPAPWVSLDARRTLPDQRDRYIAFLQANWMPARDKAREQGHVIGYEILQSPATSPAPGGWDVLLVTVYRDSATAANAEEVFRPILAARELVRIDGMGSRELSVGLWSTIMRRHARRE